MLPVTAVKATTLITVIITSAPSATTIVKPSSAAGCTRWSKRLISRMAGSWRKDWRG